MRHKMLYEISATNLVLYELARQPHTHAYARKRAHTHMTTHTDMRTLRCGYGPYAMVVQEVLGPGKKSAG